jgi:hypothetical protein
MKKRKLKVALKAERMHTWCGAIKMPVCHRYFAVERSCFACRKGTEGIHLV